MWLTWWASIAGTPAPEVRANLYLHVGLYVEEGHEECGPVVETVAAAFDAPPADVMSGPFWERRAEAKVGGLRGHRLDPNSGTGGRGDGGTTGRGGGAARPARRGRCPVSAPDLAALGRRRRADHRPGPRLRASARGGLRRLLRLLAGSRPASTRREFEPVTLPPHCPGLLPLTDPALREVV
ncbi:hypothetical protein [Salinispora arenicola]|uniref:hypothetical protein n=1 Tax=Salinispora arenicola TaxID=168697 RepID=UPI003F5CC3D4